MERFIHSKTFQGKKDGYYFGTSSEGTGYFLDSNNSSSSKKRQREPESSVDIDALESARGKDGYNLDPISAKTLPLLLSKLSVKHAKNEEKRLKFPDDPIKFMDSELELFAILEHLHGVAAEPSLYPMLMKGKEGARSPFVETVLACMVHENADVCVAAIELLRELGEADAVSGQPTAAPLLNVLVSEQTFSAVHESLTRLDEAVEAEYRGCHSALGIIENALEVRPRDAVALLVAGENKGEATLLAWMLERAARGGVDDIAGQCAEVISMAAVANVGADGFSHSLHAVKVPLSNSSSPLNGVEALLTAINKNRKIAGGVDDEEEFLTNIFLALGTALAASPANQACFRDVEGMELMFKLLKDRRFAATCVPRALRYAVAGSVDGCLALIEGGGLGYLCPLLLGRGLPRNDRGKFLGEKRPFESALLATFSELCACLVVQRKDDQADIAARKAEAAVRVVGKLAENNAEKAVKLVGTLVTSTERLNFTEFQLNATRARMVAEGADAEEVEEFESEEFQIARRLEGGLADMQDAAIVLAAAGTHRSAREYIAIALGKSDFSWVEVRGVLLEAVSQLTEEEQSERHAVVHELTRLVATYK